MWAAQVAWAQPAPKPCRAGGSPPRARVGARRERGLGFVLAFCGVCGKSLGIAAIEGIAGSGASVQRFGE